MIPDISPSGHPIFKDDGMMFPDRSLKFLEQTLKILNGKVIKIIARRGDTDRVYNTKFFTDRNEELWFSGFTCGINHAGALGLCEAIKMLNWCPKFIPAKEVVRVVLNNRKFIMQFHPTEKKKKLIITGGFDNDTIH